MVGIHIYQRCFSNICWAFREIFCFTLMPNSNTFSGDICIGKMLEKAGNIFCNYSSGIIRCTWTIHFVFIKYGRVIDFIWLYSVRFDVIFSLNAWLIACEHSFSVFDKFAHMLVAALSWLETGCIMAEIIFNKTRTG